MATLPGCKSVSACNGVFFPTEWLGDVRFGLRMLLKKPGSNAAVLLALALGIGMNVAVFSFVNVRQPRPRVR